MSAAEIAAWLGGAHRSGPWWRCRCPVHHSRGPSLALRDGDRGLVVRCWAGCEPRDVLAELRRRGLIERAAEDCPVSASARHDVRDDGAGRIELARRIWDAAREARGSPVSAYLAGRGITIAPSVSLRHALALRRPDGTYGPAMVARIDNIDGEMIGVHRTWLARDVAGDWHHGDRRMLGRAAAGAVRLAPVAETLMVGEGIETCLAAMQSTAQPAWAALSTSGLIALGLPPMVRQIIILADHDLSGAGERAAYAAASRWLAEGRRVRIALPPECADFNDVLLGRAYAKVRHAAA